VSCESKFSVREIKLRRDWIEREEAAKWRERERENFVLHTQRSQRHTLSEENKRCGWSPQPLS